MIFSKLFYSSFRFFLYFLPTNCLSVFDHFVGLALKGLKDYQYYLLVGKRCYHLKNSEAATRGVLRKKVFLEILQTSQENTCARASFLIKLQAAWGLQLY